MKAIRGKKRVVDGTLTGSRKAPLTQNHAGISTLMGSELEKERNGSRDESMRESALSHFLTPPLFLVLSAGYFPKPFDDALSFPTTPGSPHWPQQLFAHTTWSNVDVNIKRKGNDVVPAALWLSIANRSNATQAWVGMITGLAIKDQEMNTSHILILGKDLQLIPGQ